MPHIHIEHSLDLSNEQISDTTSFVMQRYADEMETTTGHIAISYRRAERNHLALGRALPDAPLILIQADVRRGRSFERKRRFALSLFEFLEDLGNIPRENMKIVFTEHSGDEMMGYDRVGEEWSEN